MDIIRLDGLSSELSDRADSADSTAVIRPILVHWASSQERTGHGQARRAVLLARGYRAERIARFDRVALQACCERLARAVEHRLAEDAIILDSVYYHRDRSTARAVSPWPGWHDWSAEQRPG